MLLTLQLDSFTNTEMFCFEPLRLVTTTNSTMNDEQRVPNQYVPEEEFETKFTTG
jgi:hypothetical protein